MAQQTKKQKQQKPHRERKSTLSYRMSRDSYQELMRRCKGSVKLAKMEILRGLNMPETFREVTKVDKTTGKVKEYYIESKYLDEIMEIIVDDL